MSNGQKKKKRLIRKRSIVEKAARKAESTEVGRTRRALHKAGAPRELYTSDGARKMQRRLEKERYATWEKLTNDPNTKVVKKRIAKFAETDPLVREVNRKMAKKKKAKLKKSVVRKRY